MKLRTSLLTFLVASLATAGAAIPLGATAASALTEPSATCTIGQYPVVDGATSNLQTECTTAIGDPGTTINAQRLRDYPNARWHSGAGRNISVSLTAGNTTGNFTGTGVLLGAADTNHTVTGLKAGFLAPRTSIVSENVGGGTFVLSVAPLKGGSTTLIVENGPGRGLGDVVLTNGSTSLLSPSGNFNSGDLNMTVDATNLPQGTTVSAVPNATHLTLSQPADGTATVDCSTTVGTPVGSDGVPCTASISSNDTTEGVAPTTTNRIFFDGVFTLGSNQMTSAMANFQTSDIGLLIVNASAKLPTNTRITAISGGGSTATMSGSAAKSVTAAALAMTKVGLPNSTAPLDGQYVSGLATSLILNPSLVDGSRPCADAIPQGTTFAGIWENPGGKGLLTAKHKPVGVLDFTGVDLGFIDNPAIGQILYPSSVVAFAAYVTQRPTSPRQYEILFPFLPVGVGVCDDTPTASAYTFLGEAASNYLSAQGGAKPGSPAVRALADLGTGTTSGSQTVNLKGYDWDGANTYVQAYSQSDTCTVVRPASLTTFPCEPS